MCIRDRLIWVCPQCGNTDQSKMNVARRTCGYIGTQFWNQGRTAEIIVEHTAEPGILLPHDYHRHMQALQHQMCIRDRL